MCRKFVLASNLDKIENRFQVHLNQNTLPIPESFNVGVGDSTYVITSENPYEIQTMKFGLTPYWAKKQMDIFNARTEGDKNKDDDPDYNGARAIFLKPAFKRPIQSQRCLIIVDAYYEWSKDKKPYLVFLQNKERPFCFAGLYDSWLNPETEKMQTGFAIITTTANELLLEIGVKRMPVILPIGYEKSWLKMDKPLSGILKIYCSKIPLDFS